MGGCNICVHGWSVSNDLAYSTTVWGHGFHDDTAVIKIYLDC